MIHVASIVSGTGVCGVKTSNTVPFEQPSGADCPQCCEIMSGKKREKHGKQRGQYTFSNLEATCKTCGHTLGEHSAERNAKLKQQECFEDGCDCEFFIKAK